MQKHTRIYFKHFGYGEQHLPNCEICQRAAVDIHHIDGRGKDKDVIENLMAVCRKCHDRIHNEMFDIQELKLIHNYTLAGKPQIFIK